MDKIEHLEFLSKLKFSDEEKVKFEKEFEDLIEFVNQITEIEIPDNIEKDNAISLNDLREDLPQDSISREEILQNAPKQKDGCFVTPLVVE